MYVKQRSQSGKRPGAVGVFTGVMLIPLVAMVAFAVDMGYIWRTDAELQNAADSAALAGTATLMDPNIRAAGGLSKAELQYLRAAAIQEAVRVASQYGDAHRAGDVGLDVSANDVTVGYIENPSAAPTSTAGSLQTASNSPFPNSVCVVVRRDASVAAGKLSLFFAGVLGLSEVERTATATATLRGGQVSGFQGAVPFMLPIAMHQETYRWLTGQRAQPPEGMQAQDNFTVKVTDLPPVTSGPDGVDEAKVFPDMPSGTSPSVLGTVSLDRDVSNPGASDLARWIDEGMTADETSSWNQVTNGRGFHATPKEPLWMDVKTGINASMKDDLANRIGTPAIMPVFDQTNGKNGSNTQFRVIGFVSVVIVDVKLTGSKSTKYVTVQLNGLMTDSASLAKASDQAGPSYIYRGAALSR